MQRLGVTVRKASPDLMMVVHMISPDGSRDQQYISNYATLYIKDALARVDGVGDVNVFGARDYSMRVWLDPGKVAARGLTADDVVAALRAANLQVAAGAINQPPATSPGAFQLSVQTLGRLTDVEQFGDIVVRADPGTGFVRIRDIARVELGSQDYTVNAYLNKDMATAIVIYQRPGSNALTTAAAVKRTMEEAKKDFPPGLDYTVVYNPTEFIQQSIDEVIRTLFEAIGLVVLVVILFLQTWRAAIIPVVAIPVSLIGCFVVMGLVGISFNTLSLFGLVLAIGIVVDDAIVVVENVERYLRDGMSPRDAAHETMDEVGSALMAIALVLCAVFIPTAFITGLQGSFYRQFAITIAAATVISAFVSLTLSPALAALLLKPHSHEPQRTLMYRLGAPVRIFFAGFNWMFERLSSGYGRLVARLVRVGVIVLVVYAALIYAAYDRLAATPTGLIPQLDRGYLIAAFQLPPGASLSRTDAVIRHASEIILARPGVQNSVAFAGFDGGTFTNAPNAGVIFVPLKPFAERVPLGLSAGRILADLRQQLAQLDDAFVFVLEPPSVPGIGTGGGLKLYVQDRAGHGLPALEQATWIVAGSAAQTPGFNQAFTLFNTHTPQVYADIDRTKAELLQVPIDRVFDALSVYMGSAYINDFNLLGRTYQVNAQADNPFRLSVRDVENLKTRNNYGDMVPIGSVATFRDTTGPFRVPRYNLYPAAEVQLTLARGFSSRPGDRGDREDRAGAPAAGLRLRMDRDRAAGEAGRQHRDGRLRAGGGVRVPAAGGAVRKLAAAARGGADRADVHPCRDAGRERPRARPQHPGGDRPGGARRPRCEECHPDRGVRAAGRDPGYEPVRGGGGRGAHPPAADPDDIACLHLRRGPARRGGRRGCGDAAVAGHRGVRRDAGRDPVRAGVHAGVLCSQQAGRTVVRTTPQPAAGDAAADRRGGRRLATMRPRPKSRNLAGFNRRGQRSPR